MGTVRHSGAHPVLWALLLCHLFLFGFSRAQLTSTSVPVCSCESFSAAPNILNNGPTSICPCPCGKVTLIPTTYTTVFTIYDPVTSGGLVLTSGLNTLNSSSYTVTPKTTTLSSPVGTISSSVSYWPPWLTRPNVTISSGKSTVVRLNHTSTSSGSRSSPGTMTDHKITSQTFFWNDTTKGFGSSFSSTPGSIYGTSMNVSVSSSASSTRTQPLVLSSSVLSEVKNPTSHGLSTPAATPTASSTLPSQTTALPNTQQTARKTSSVSLLTSSAVPAIVPPGGTVTIEPLTAISAEADGTYRTTSVTWLSIDVPTTTTVSGQSIATQFPAWRCISLDLCYQSCLVPEEVCLPAPSSNPNGYPWPEKPRLPPSLENGSTIPASSTQLITSTTGSVASRTTTPASATTKSVNGGGSDSGGDKDGGDDGEEDEEDNGDGGNDDDEGDNGDHGNDDDDSDDDGDGDNGDDDDDDSFLDGLRIDLGINLGIDLGTSTLSNALRDIFGWGMSTGFGTNSPFGGGGGGGGGSGETEPDEPKKSATTSRTTSSCTVTYTLAPHCTQPCVVSQIKTLGTSSYTTSCATATCRTTQVCTSIQTTTTTSFTTKRPERTAACMPKKCPACQQNTAEASSKMLEARRGFWDEIILKDTITEPETWEGGENDWWEKMRRVAKSYGPGLHIDSKYRMDSSSSWTPFSNAPHGGGAGPVWGCVMVVAFSPQGVFASHLWEIPNFRIPTDEEGYFDVDAGYNEDYYFKQNIEMFLQQGSAAFPFQQQYPALAPLVDAGGPLHPKDSGFFRTIVFVPTHETGEMFYKRDNRRLINFLSDKIKIDKKYITIYGYLPRFDLGKDFDYDHGRATPPPRIRASNPWDGLFSWLYTHKGPSGQRELVVRYEKNVIHREAWCGVGRAIPDAPPSNFELRPKKNRPRAVLQPRQEDATCGRFIVCGLGGPQGLCGDYRKYPPPALSGQPQKRQLPPSNGPSKAERELSTDIMIDPEDAIGGEVWWWDRMRNVVNERGAGYGGLPDHREHWSTSAMITFDQEVDGTVADRPRFGGSGPIWGCSAIIVASPEAVWTSHIWEIPSHARGEAHGKAAFEHWKNFYPRPTVEYFQEEFLDFLENGNTKGNFRQLYEYKFPGRNPGLKYMFAEKGAFNVKEKEFVWVGIVTRSYKNLDMPRIQYDWQIQQVYEKFVAWGVDPANIMVKAYPARLDFTVGGPQIKPHWGVLSWQYHPKHKEGNHEERKIRVRFEKELLFEKSWCGSGVKIAGSGGTAPTRRRREEIEACKMVVSSRESASASRVATALPEPTLACTGDAACGSLSCPENRISACYHDFCHCVILANPNNTEIMTGTVYATPTTTLGASQTPTFPVSWLLPSVTTTAQSITTSLKSSILTSTFASVSSPSSSPPRISSTTTVVASKLTVTSSSITSTASSMFTLTISAWNPEESPGTTCATKEDCSALKCPDDKQPDCRVKDGPKPGCHCFDKPKKLLDVCSTASDCASVDCEARHAPTCRPLVDFPGATPICLCDAEPIAPGATCLVDTHCDGLPCEVANQRGSCRSNACRCDFFLSEGAGCSAHDDCSAIRCSEAKPHKACSAPGNACECSAAAPVPRRAEGDPCSADAECATIGCTDFEATVCEAGACRCRAWKCGSDKDCASSGKACGGEENLRCEAGRCACKRCTATTKILGCGSDGDCNHCCARGRLPKCVYGCQSFWCGKECQCEAW